MTRRLLLGVAFLLAGCGGGGSGGSGSDAGPPGGGGAKKAALLIAAGTVQVLPAADASWADGIDFGRLGITRGDVDVVYDLTTPAGERFLFDVLSRRAGNAGAVSVSVAHAADGGVAPLGGPETLGAAGIVPSASGAVVRTPWLEAHGDGFSRVGLRGSVDRDQVFAVEAFAGGRTTRALVRVRIGPESVINLAALPGGDYPGVEESATLYSSNSWAFGLPTAAVSGDRTTVVVYEGDRVDPTRYERYEMRLQRDDLTGAVTGGASEETGPDSGNWRDHETAGLYNTLALARSGADAVTLSLSFDRGATFGQVEGFSSGDTWYAPRLVQVSMALDYSLAVLFWRAGRTGNTELVLVEGRPSAYDAGGSPSRFAFDPVRVLRRIAGDVTPMLMGATWSAGGDLVLGYATSSFTSNADGTWTSLTQSRCASRLFGEAEFTDTVVEEEEIVGRDPSVAVLGSGPAMRVFFAYEASDGVRLRASPDGGKTFGAAIPVGDASASVPSVLAREQGGAARVDVLYLSQGAEGCELRTLHWDDWGVSAPADYRLTTAETIPSASAPRDRPVPGGAAFAPFPDQGFRVRQVAWFGYDAVLDGDDVVVVYDEVTYDAMTMLGGGWFVGAPGFEGGVMFPAGADFAPATPPPLAPGLTGPVPAPDPDHMHQLKLLRLD